MFIDPITQTSGWCQSSDANRHGPLSEGCSLKKTVESAVFGNLCTINVLGLFEVVIDFRTRIGELRLKPSSMRIRLTSPRTRSRGVYSWVRVSARGEGRDKNRER